MTGQHLQKALQLMSRRPVEAAKELRLVLAEEPDNAYVHGLLSACLLDAGDTQAALEEARRSISADPTAPLGFHVLAHYHFQQGNLIDAEVAVEEAIQLNPEEPRYYALLADIHYHDRNLEAALQAAESGLALDAQDIQCHCLRALISSKMGKSDQAQGSIDAALANDPENALTHACQGWTLLETHQYEESRTHFREALRLDPTSTWARAGLIKSLEMRNWAYDLHRKLSSKWIWLVVLVWFTGNFYLIAAIHTAAAALQPVLTAAALVSCTMLLVFAFFTFLPYTLVGEPILRFFLQFDPDGKYVLTPDEQRVYKHLMFFIAGTALTIVLGIVTNTWLPLGIVLVLYIGTLPYSYPDEMRRKRSVWAGHFVGAAFVALLIVWCTFCNPNSHSLQIIGIAQFARFLMLPSLLKLAGGASIFKVLASGPVIKGLGALGLGGAGALKALRDKEKQKARARMLGNSDK